MYSEVEQLIRQLEYCVLAKHPKAAKEIVKLLIKHKAKLSLECDPVYKCDCHDLFFPGSKLMLREKKFFEYFERCKHFVCNVCLNKYIKENFEISGYDFPFYCPGCLINGGNLFTELDQNQVYFKNAISGLKDVNQKIEELNEKDKKVRESREAVTAKCQNFMFHKEEYIDDLKRNLLLYGYAYDMKKFGQEGYESEDLKVIPGCSHCFCKDCLKSIFYEQVVYGMPKKCLNKECNIEVNDSFIAQFFNFDKSDDFSVLTKLKLSDYLYVKCINCNANCQLPKSKKSFKCSNLECDFVLCCLCGYLEHLELDCYEKRIKKKKLRVNIDGKNKKILSLYKEYECRRESTNHQLKSHYFNAFTLFQWKISENIYHKLYELNENFPRYEMKIKKVTYILNENLQKDYAIGRQELRKATGSEPKETFVFHGSKEENYDSICREGLKIGGHDVTLSTGKRYGYGIYTADDPITSAFYAQSSKLLICQALLGRKTEDQVDDPKALENFDYDYKVVENDVQFQEGSTYFIFFKKNQIMPIYLVEFT